MNRFVRILIVLLLVVSLPLMIFISKSANDLSENEEMVQRVFDQQLETLLFTINQNSENIVNSWTNQLDLYTDPNGELMKLVVKRLFENHAAIQQIKFFDLDDLLTNANYNRGEINTVLTPDLQLKNKLIQFNNQGYKRTEAFRNGNFTNLYYLSSEQNNRQLLAISIKSNSFIEQNLFPGIQQISQDRFNISIGDTTLSEMVGAHTTALWYLPDFAAKIELKATTIEQLVKARSKREIYIFWGMLVMVIAGLTFVALSIRKEIRLAEMKSEFVSNVSHEIRTPLALVRMYSETLLMKRVKNEEKEKEYLKVIHEEANRLTNMVNRILSFSRMERNKRIYNMEKTDLLEVMNNIRENFCAQYTESDVDCLFKISVKDAIVLADKDAVVECMVNLIDNAVKYGKKDNKRVEIRLRKDAKWILLDVEDNGIGIQTKHLKHIFDKFYRVTTGDKALKAKGSGIGLNLVQEIMKSHKGKVSVKSKFEEGSCFTLHFPKM